MAWITTTTLLLLAAALVLTVIRLVRGPSLADRVVALELISLIAVAFIITCAVQADHTAFMDVALVLALTGFMATVGFARFIERGGPGDE